MKVTQEKLPASQIGLEIEITPEMSQQAYEKALQEFKRFANIPGFRKGKVPRQVLIQRLGPERIKASVVNELIQDGLKQALEQLEQGDIAAIGNPELRSSFDELVQQFQPGAVLTFSAAVDVAPEVTLKQYSGLQVQAEEFKYDPARVDQVLEDYRKRSATLVPVEERPAQQGDIARVDFSGRLTGELAEGESAEIPGGSAEDFEIELTEGRFIPGFIDGIIGMQPEETKEVSVAFPDDYPQPDLAGKPAVFTITLKELKERELPELDDDFAQEISDFESLAELRESLESRFQKEAEQKTDQSKQEALLNRLVEELEVELPETMIRREVDHSITQTAIQLSQQGMDIKKTFTQEIIAMLREQARPEALDRLKRTLVLGEIAKKESLAVEPDAVQAKVEEQLAEYRERGMDDDIDLERLREVVEEDLLREKIFAWLEENNTIELVPEGSLQPTESEAEPEAESDAAAVETPAELSASETGEATASETTIDVEAVPAEPTSEPTTPAEAVEVPAEPAETVEPSEPPAEKPAKAKTAAKKSSKSTESAKKSRTSKQSS
ncbi:trigger factor [Leptolyngbya sp. NK1-12]|uniref:Trigger factor n=1 Tax=Leptolyngbya sp. NK1-12 TaxID=2547451 RepID=A0AA97ARL9_9CYAN|nr:trigger factor [Leptolyngbya sp. NK1-12]WNZ25503.1 trigger factor [Leptolyngbya sp. NK1-12]